MQDEHDCLVGKINRTMDILCYQLARYDFSEKIRKMMTARFSRTLTDLAVRAEKLLARIGLIEKFEVVA